MSRRSHYSQGGLSLDERRRGRQAALHGHEGITRQSSASWSTRLSFTLIMPKRRSSKVVPGVGRSSPPDWINQVWSTSYTLGVTGAGPVDDLVQARLGHDELEHGSLVDHEDHLQGIDLIG